MAAGPEWTQATSVVLVMMEGGMAVVCTKEHLEMEEVDPF